MQIPTDQELIDLYAANEITFRKWVIVTLDGIKTLLEQQSDMQQKIDNLTAEIIGNTAKMTTVQK